MKNLQNNFNCIAFKSCLILGAFIMSLSFNTASAAFVKGEILVGFNDSTTEAEVDALVKSLDLTWESKFPVLFGIQADYKPEILGEQGFELRSQMANKITEEDRKLAQKPYTNYLVLNTRVNDKILIMFNNRATEDQAKEFISRFDGLKFISFNRASSYGIVKVPAGEEQKWIEAFQKIPIVRYAELNQLGTLTSSSDSSDSRQNIYLVGSIIVIMGVASFFVLRKRQSK